MEIPARPWIPGTTRNRWAWGFAWASQAVFLLWNLMPYYRFEYDPGMDRETWIFSGCVITQIWPDIVRDLYGSLQSTPGFEDWLSIMATLALFFLAVIQFLLAPLWRLISASRLLRFIPAGLCILGFLVIVYFICDDLIPLSESDYFSLFALSMIGLNFLLSILSLCFYHPEPAHLS